MTVELISVGTEILMGNTVNNNTQSLVEKCAMFGFDLFFQVAVGGSCDRMMSVVRQGLPCSDIFILTGGLGSTEDDLTKEVRADTFGVSLEEDTHTRERLTEFFRNNIYRHIPENNWKMATVPRGAVVLDNANGMAPGLILEKNDKTVILLPGSPSEPYPMSNGQVFSYLQQKQSMVLVPGMVKTYGYGENQVEDMFLDLIDAQTNPTIATYAKAVEVHSRITARVGSRKEGLAPIASAEKEIKDRFKEAIFTTDEQVSPEMVVVSLLKQNNLTMCTTESCTGGMIAARAVNVSGASDVLMEGMVTYLNEARMCLPGVCENTLKAWDVVSEETARGMAEGGVKASGTDLCVATTDIAGPDGGTDERPVGLVYMACCLRGKTCVRKYQFRSNREKMQEQAMMKSLDPARPCILGKS